MRETPRKTTSRRNFLRAAGGTSALAVAAAATLRPSEAQAYDPGDDETKGKYRETEHVKAFYRVNTYPSTGK
jgi:hypothetical protein